MRENRTEPEPGRAVFAATVPELTRVQGLGLCDAIRVVLAPCQIAGLIEELEERRGPLTEAFEHARTRWDELAERDGGAAVRLGEEISKSAYAQRVLTMVRGQLPTATHEAPVSIVGPASMISSIVAAVAVNAVEDLAELVRQSLRTDVRAQRRLVDATTTVAAWVETYIECEALEWFNFDPAWDPVERVT